MFQLKSVSEMRNEELMSFKLKWSFHIIRIKLKYDSHSYFSGQKKSRLSHRLDSRDHLYSFKLLDLKDESNQPRYDSTDRVINISKWGETQVIWARWGEKCGQFITRRAGGARCNVLCFTAGCLLSILQPPLFDLSRWEAPAPAHTRHQEMVTPSDMRHVTHTWDTGRGSTQQISPVTGTQIMNWSHKLSRDKVLRAWHVMCDVVTALVTQLWRKQDRCYHLIC